MLNLVKDYFIAGEKHICMFCSTPLAKVTDEGKMLPLGNKAHIYFSKTSPGLYVINCCKECAKNADLKTQEVLDIIHENVVQCKNIADIRAGKSPEQIAQLNASRNEDKPVIGFMHIETGSRSNALVKYKEFLKSKQS